MPDNGLLNEVELIVDDVGQLADAQQLTHFFHNLGYEVGDGGAYVFSSFLLLAEYDKREKRKRRG